MTRFPLTLHRDQGDDVTCGMGVYTGLSRNKDIKKKEGTWL